jgi:hypothetical protein
MRRAQEKLNKRLKIGDSIEYFRIPTKTIEKTKKGNDKEVISHIYVLREEVQTKEQLDLKYYKNSANKALAIFKLDIEEPKKEKKKKKETADGTDSI